METEMPVQHPALRLVHLARQQDLFLRVSPQSMNQPSLRHQRETHQLSRRLQVLRRQQSCFLDNMLALIRSLVWPVPSSVAFEADLGLILDLDLDTDPNLILIPNRAHPNGIPLRLLDHLPSLLLLLPHYLAVGAARRYRAAVATAGGRRLLPTQLTVPRVWLRPVLRKVVRLRLLCSLPIRRYGHSSRQYSFCGYDIG